MDRLKLAVRSKKKGGGLLLLPLSKPAPPHLYVSQFFLFYYFGFLTYCVSSVCILPVFCYNRFMDLLAKIEELEKTLADLKEVVAKMPPSQPRQYGPIDKNPIIDEGIKNIVKNMAADFPPATVKLTGRDEHGEAVEEVVELTDKPAPGCEPYRYLCQNPKCRTRYLHMPPRSECPVCRIDRQGEETTWAVKKQVVTQTLTDGSPVTPDHKEIDPRTGMQKGYVVLSEAERAKGFIRPVRISYKHVGTPGPKYPLRDLTDDERAQYDGLGYGYVKYETYPETDSLAGRYWTQAQLDKIGKGCGVVTRMNGAIAETYARNPMYYSGTFCCACGTHLPVGPDGEFVWEGTNERVGT